MGREVKYTITSTDTIVVGDIGEIIEANHDDYSASTPTELVIFIPADTDPVTFNDQDEIRILRSAGPVTISAADSSGVIVNGDTNGSVSIFKEYGLATLVKIAANTWAVAGDVIGDLDTDLGIPQANIPSLSDPANIQTAFNRYHYGTDTTITDPDNLIDGSIAKYLYILNTKVEASGAGEVVMNDLDAINLNEVVTPGHYYSVLEPANDLNYPEDEETILPGILSVYKASATGLSGVTQTYQSLPSLTSETPIIWSRSSLQNNTSSWTAWMKVAPSDLTNYYTKTEIDNRTLSQIFDVTITSPSNDQVLTYDDGQWINKTPSTLAGYAYLDRQIFTNSGFFNPLTAYPASTIRAVAVTAVGGGGGGGGAAGGNTAGPNKAALGAGGGGGAYVQTFVALTLSTTLQITVGSAGSAGSSSGGNGGAGGNTIVRISTNGTQWLVANGGSGGGGQVGFGASSAVGSGGTGSILQGKGITIPGGIGSRGSNSIFVVTASTLYFEDAVQRGYGGGSILSSFSGGTGSSANGLNYGGGGSGGSTTSRTGANEGGAGAKGIVILDIYV